LIATRPPPRKKGTKQIDTTFNEMKGLFLIFLRLDDCYVYCLDIIVCLDTTTGSGPDRHRQRVLQPCLPAHAVGPRFRGLRDWRKHACSAVGIVSRHHRHMQALSKKAIVPCTYPGTRSRINTSELAGACTPVDGPTRCCHGGSRCFKILTVD
jgi:hypothetical protein